MTEPVSSTALGALYSVAFVGYFVGIDAGTILGSFAGAIFFVVSANEYKTLPRTALGLISFIAGIIFSRPLGNYVLGLESMKSYSGEKNWIDAVLAFGVSAFVVVGLMYVKNNGVTGIMKHIPFIKWGSGNDK